MLVVVLMAAVAALLIVPLITDDIVDATDTGEVIESSAIEGLGTVPLAKLPARVPVDTADRLGARVRDAAGSDAAGRAIADAEAEICGSVILQDGTVPRTRVRVYAWPSGGGGRPPLRQFSPAIEPGPDVLWARTEVNGRFVLSGLRAGVAYNLVAGAQGWVSSSTQSRVMAGSTDARLTLWRIYACALKVREPGGLLPPLCRKFASRTCSSQVGHAAHSATLTSLDFVLSGLNDFVVSSNRWDWRDFVLAYKDGRDRDRLGSEVVCIQVPGFRVLNARVPLFALGSTLPSRTVHIQRTASGFGVIDVELVSGLAPTPHQSMSGPSAGKLKLRSTDGGEDLEVGFDRVGGLKQRVCDVPFGAYEATFNTCRGGYLAKPDTKGGIVRVGPRPVSLRFDVSELAAMRLRLLDAEGKPLEGPCAVVVRGGGRSVDGFATFMSILARRPYLVQGLVAGEWKITIAPSRAGQKFKKKTVQVQIRPGVVHDQDITVEQIDAGR